MDNKPEATNNKKEDQDSLVHQNTPDQQNPTNNQFSTPQSGAAPVAPQSSSGQIAVNTIPPNNTTVLQDSTPPQVSSVNKPEGSHSGAGLVVLQWLTYAFWGWAVLALSSLTAAIIANFINKADVGTFTPFAIAALVVLLPVAFVCDHFYSKKEPVKKTGGATAVMLIHAVIFALFGVGALIAAVVSIFMLILGTDDDSRGLITTLLCALIVSAYYAAVLVRTLNPSRFPGLSKIFRLGMAITIGIIIVMGIIGPVARERSLRNDRLLEKNLDSLSSAIDSYANKNDKLPNSLSDLSNPEEGVKKLIDKKLVEYKPETSRSSNTYDRDILGEGYKYNSSREYFTYELCVTFKEESLNYGSYSSPDSEFSSYIDGYRHPKGYHCYKKKTYAY